MEQHGNKLYDDDGKEEEHEDDTNWLEMKILLGDENLGIETRITEGSMLSDCLTNYNTYARLAAQPSTRAQPKPVFWFQHNIANCEACVAGNRWSRSRSRNDNILNYRNSRISNTGNHKTCEIKD